MYILWLYPGVKSQAIVFVENEVKCCLDAAEHAFEREDVFPNQLQFCRRLINSGVCNRFQHWSERIILSVTILSWGFCCRRLKWITESWWIRRGRSWAQWQCRYLSITGAHTQETLHGAGRGQSMHPGRFYPLIARTMLQHLLIDCIYCCTWGDKKRRGRW